MSCLYLYRTANQTKRNKSLSVQQLDQPNGHIVKKGPEYAIRRSVLIYIFNLCNSQRCTRRITLDRCENKVIFLSLLSVTCRMALGCVTCMNIGDKSFYWVLNMS
jgi:hypothetical protein